MHHDALLDAMIRLYAGEAKRINHFLKVYALAQTIALQEQVSNEMLSVIETVAICHDIGIHISEKKYGQCTFAMQQSEGAVEGRKLLSSLGYPAQLLERVCHIIAFHHTFDAIDGLDFQILVEADLLVNLDEKQSDATQIEHMRNTVFKTPTGIKYLTLLFHHRG